MVSITVDCEQKKSKAGSLSLKCVAIAAQATELGEERKDGHVQTMEVDPCQELDGDGSWRFGDPAGSSHTRR